MPGRIDNSWFVTHEEEGNVFWPHNVQAHRIECVLIHDTDQPMQPTHLLCNIKPRGDQNPLGGVYPSLQTYLFVVSNGY